MSGVGVVSWIGGALKIDGRRGAVLIDAPPGVARALTEAGELKDVAAVVVSTGRARSVAGLLGLWDALDRLGRRELTVVHVLGDERTPLLAAAWAQGWPGGLRLDLDGCAPSTVAEAAGLAIELVPLRVGDMRGGRDVQAVAGCGVRVEDGAVTWVPTCRPGTSAQRLARGAGLAVVEVGVVPWPVDVAPWRLARADAELVAGGAHEAWLVGDDGARLPDAAPPN